MAKWIEFVVLTTTENLPEQKLDSVFFLNKKYVRELPEHINPFFWVNGAEEASEKIALLCADPSLIQELI